MSNYQVFEMQRNHLAESSFFILLINHFSKSNFQIFKIKFLRKIRKSSRKMKLLVLNGITRVFSIIYFMIKTRFKLNTITTVVTGALFESKVSIVKWPCSKKMTDFYQSFYTKIVRLGVIDSVTYILDDFCHF